MLLNNFLFYIIFNGQNIIFVFQACINDKKLFYDLFKDNLYLRQKVMSISSSFSHRRLILYFLTDQTNLSTLNLAKLKMLNALFPSFYTFLLCLLSICTDNSILIQKPHSHLLNKATKLHAPTYHKHLLDPTTYIQRVNTLTHFRRQNQTYPKYPSKVSLYFLPFPIFSLSQTTQSQRTREDRSLSNFRVSILR